MKVEANWCMRTLLVVFMCVVALAALSCGGKGGSTLSNQTSSVKAGDAASSDEALRLITEDEIASLPQWQQDLLNDPGWDQPAIAQRTETVVPEPPSFDELMASVDEAMARGLTLAPRGLTGDSKGASWNDQDNWPGNIATSRGEYEALYPGDVPYGCKHPSQTLHGHSSERNIAAASTPQGANQAISYVEEGVTEAVAPFNMTGGTAQSDSPLAAVYQLFSNDSGVEDTRKSPEEYLLEGDPLPNLAEISYRADGGPGASGPCDAGVEAFVVRDFFWYRFNSTMNATPGRNEAIVYNILVAPSSELSGQETNQYGTVGRIQSFYMGSLSECYGGAAIVGLFSTTSSCQRFADFVNDTDALRRYNFHNVVMGVIHQRWMDSAVESLDPPNDDAWDTDFGWPVTPPTAFNGGASTHTPQGAYYLWGQHFERGFMYWVDYTSNANVPDEAQAWSFTGDNVFCREDVTKDFYEKLPTVYYGGDGPLGVTVVVEASLNPFRGPGTPAAGSFYEVGITEDDGPQPLDMHAHGFGGTPQAGTCAYKHYTWAYRDGTIGQTNNTPFSDSTKYVQHTYAEQAVYTVRVQIVDAADNIAYGDSLPIHVGTGSAGGSAEIRIIRADGGTYNANYNALVASLDAVGATHDTVDYSATAAEDLEASDAKVAIWYRGGPGAAGEPNLTTAWPAGQLDELMSILNSGTKRKVLLMSQSHQSSTFVQVPPYTNYWVSWYGATGPTGPNTVPFTQFNRDFEGYHPPDNLEYWIFAGFTYMLVPAQSFVGAITGSFGTFSSGAAERFGGPGSSNNVPVSFSFTNRQFMTRPRYQPFDNAPFQMAGGGANWHNGVTGTQDAGFFGMSNISYGNSAAPGFSGSGKFWTVGYSWSDMSVTGGSASKDDVLQNILAWLDGSLTFSAKTNDGFVEYEGVPEILTVTPAFWDEVDYEYRAGSPSSITGFGQTVAGGSFPDPSTLDVYRTNDNPALSNEIPTTDPNNNWVNGNDLDFGFPWYAYVDDGANNTVQWGTAAGSSDDSIMYAGLLLNDGNSSWARVTPPAGQEPIVAFNEEAADEPGRNPRPVVAGYYAGTESGDEVRASYGTGMESFEANGFQWDNKDRLTVETVAHWPQSLKYFGFGGFDPEDANLQWSLYPGQNMTQPGTTNVIGLDVDWDVYRRSFDVDPSFAVAGRTGSRWNRPSFNFTDVGTNGRVVEFNMRSVRSWNPDLNRDGNRDTADKYPVRVRLFTNHQTYLAKSQAVSSTWPNHLHDPGLSPAAQPDAALRNATFIEGGTYVVDRGEAVYNLDVQDDTAQPNPGEPGTLTGGTGAYEVDLYFTVRFGNGVPGGYDVELDTDYNGVFNSGPNGYAIQTAGNFDSAGNIALLDVDIPSNQPDGGPYTFAIRVTDADGVQDVYAWTTPVVLAPPFQVVILQDPLSTLVGGVNRAVQNLQNDLTTLYGPGSVTTRNLGTNPLTPGSLANYDGIMWCSDVAFSTSAPPAPYGYTMGAGNANATEVINQVNNGKLLFIVGGGSQGLSHFSVANMNSIMPFPGGQTWFFDGQFIDMNNNHKFYSSQSSVPNSVWGFDTWQATSLGPKSQQQNVFTTSGTTVKNVEGWWDDLAFNGYAAGARRQAIGAGQGKVQHIMFNYGDFDTTQGGPHGNPKARHLLLENLLCMGDFFSPFNSQATP